MKKLAYSVVRNVVSDSHWESKIRAFGIYCHPKEPGCPLDPVILRQIYFILKIMPISLVKDCGITELYISNEMGRNRPKYPNHGFYIHNSVTLNSDIFYHPDKPDDFFDHLGYFCDRPTQTLIHEFGHGYDVYHGDISEQTAWLKLSGWSETKKPRLKRLIIREPGVPEVVGEWYHDPDAGYTRFYARRNPWDDFADSFAFYCYGMKNKLPENKVKYFDRLLKKYY